MPDYQLLCGDVFKRMRDIPDESIDLCLTSPPYWGLRAYGVEGELGREETLDLYLDHTLMWVKETFRVLRPTGSLVLNLGDSFYGSWGGGYDKDRHATRGDQENQPYGFLGKKNSARTARYYKEKMLLSVSNFAYVRIVSETDFVLRGEHLWLKPNVPSPIRSRLKHSHEKVFWFVKDAAKYYFNPKPWLKPVTKSTEARILGAPNTIAAFADGIGLSPTSRFRGGNSGVKEDKMTIEHSWRIIPVGEKQKGFEIEDKEKQEHVAPFPEALIKPYLESLCPPDGTILDPFVGSGTTIKVARDIHRSAIGIDINKKSLDYAKKRCGLKAIEALKRFSGDEPNAQNQA